MLLERQLRIAGLATMGSEDEDVATLKGRERPGTNAEICFF